MKKIVVVGEILVEIMADQPGLGFSEPIALTGPYPSGAPAIFIDQVAKLGQPCAIVSTVGDDDFGVLNIERLRRDGVNVSGIGIDADRPTGSAFVRYRPDGARDFVYNIRHSACGTIHQTTETRRVLESADHFHVMGSSLSSPEIVRLNLNTAHDVKRRGGTVSFDPNLRKVMLNATGVREAMTDILAVSDLFLPSGEELTLLTVATEAAEAVREVMSLGVQSIVHKLGSAGVRYHDGKGTQFMPAFQVEETDPTGAGDSFGGAFITYWLRGTDIRECLLLACAAGARAVMHRGPMEGTSTLDDLNAFFASQRTKSPSQQEQADERR